MKKVLLLDNNDSFTFNIVDYLRRMQTVDYCVVKSNDLDIATIDNYDKVIISPGPGLPSDFPILNDVYNNFVKKKPILGICLGHQALAEYFGAALIQLYPVVHGQAHALRIIKKDPIFDGIPDRFKVGLYHSWAVDPNTLPKELACLAISENDVIMAVKHRIWPVYGVQFHPESHITDHGYTMLKNFIEL